MTIYVIKKLNIDPLENNYENAVQYNLIGYTKTLERAFELQENYGLYVDWLACKGK